MTNSPNYMRKLFYIIDLCKSWWICS